MRSWNSIGTLATGPIADVAAGGAIAVRDRPLMVELWVRAGDRWVRPAQDPATRQRRIDGLPVIETRVRVGGDDLVLTAWADEGGDGRGRVLVSIENPLSEPAAVAAVVRPQTVLGPGRAESIRVVDRYVVVDGRPLVQLPHDPVDIAVGSEAVGSAWSTDLEGLLGDELVGATEIAAAEGAAALAAMWPLAAGATETVAVIDGRSRTNESPTPVSRVLAGWKAHLGPAAEVALPGWPAHLWPALLSGLLLRVEESTPPLGGEPGRRRDVAVATALALVGLDTAAAIEIDRLLQGMTDGSIPREDWGLVGVACSRVGPHADDSVLRAHPAAVAAAGGELLGLPLAGSARIDVLRAIGRAGGERAAADAAGLPHAAPSPGESLASVARLGPELEPGAWRALATAATGLDPREITDLAFRLVLGARGGPAADVVAAVRSAAGSSWRWEHRGAGDSPEARAALVIALRSAAVRELDGGLDLVPGFLDGWLGQSVDVRDLPTTWGKISYSIRWHGARPAVLWEIEPSDPAAELQVTATALDPSFRASDRSGEALLTAPSWGQAS